MTREQAIDYAVRRATTSRVRLQMSAYVNLFGVDKTFVCDECDEGETTGYGEEIDMIRAEFASLGTVKFYI